MRLLRFENQNYDRLKSSCLSKNKLFVDNAFPADASSLFKSKRLDVEWKRPHELCQNPKLVVDGTASHDVLQGQLGNCWFVAASATLAASKTNWDRVIPDLKEQERNGKNKYAGIYKFRFWQFGNWIEVVIDDLLPTINGRLIFTHSSTKNEFWSSLLEKAYAKINGCYEHLDGGSLSEALQDFTGGVCETIKINKANGKNKKLNGHDTHFETLKKAYDRKSLQSAAINITHRDQMEEKMDCGLIKGHAYSITKLNKMTIGDNKFFSFISSSDNEKLYMIRLRNPWGTKEWNGNWSDGSDSWKKVPQRERDRMGLNYEEDGEFWMEFNDFLYYFDEVSICRIMNTSIISIRKTWYESTVFSKWSIPNRAGGCVNYRDTFCDNPQFMFEINHDDEKPDEVLINLDQLSRRAVGKPNLTIGLFVMRVEDNRTYRLHDIKQKVASSTYVNSRSIFLRQKMTNGRYVVIPSTYDPNIEGRFMLRVYSDENHNLKQLTKDCPRPFCFRFNPFAKYADCVTSLNVKSAAKLQNVEGKGSFDSYVRILCEGEKVTGRVFKSSLNPEWETTALFYRFKQTMPIIVEIWIKRSFKDELYGSISLDAEPNNRHMMLQSSLNKVSGDARKSGTVTIEVKSMTNITSI